MNDLNNVVHKTGFKVSVKHHFDSSELELDTLYFSKVNTFYSEKRKDSIPVMRWHTLNTLSEELNGTGANKKKENSTAILKGVCKGGISGKHIFQASPFLFFDIDVKVEENPHLLDSFKNNEVFEQLKKIAVLVWRSYSGKGISGVLYVPQLEKLLNNDRAKHLKIGNAICTYITKTLNINVEFDHAQNKFRQIRYLARQIEPRSINKTPYVFIYDVSEVVKVDNTGVKEYQFADNRAVFGSIQDQFNKSTDIRTALLDNGFMHVSGNRYKHPLTTSKTTGLVKGNVFFNHSSSFSSYKVFTAFWLYLTESYDFDNKRFLEDLKAKGYEDKQPQQNTFKQAETNLKINTDDRQKQIFAACYDLINAPYEEKVKFANENAQNKIEKILFYDYLKIKQLAIKYDKTIIIKNYVGEQLSIVLNYADTHEKTILTAETGTGKTTAFLNDFEELRPEKRGIILVPLTVIVEQSKSEYKNLIGLTANSAPEEHAEAKKSPLVMATYEQGYKHLASGNTFDYVIIDEAHNLITSQSFKKEAINNLTSLLPRFNVIGLTGTINPLFKSLGYKLIQVKQAVLMPVPVVMRIDNRSPLKIILQHLNIVKGKCIFRINSIDMAADLKAELINLKLYTDNEILILNSAPHIKKGDDFKQLTEKSNFAENIKIIFTTSLIDEGLSIKQDGFTDVVFIENTYRPSPESVKQFFARFRNKDIRRKNYYYFREPKEQFYSNWNPSYAFNQRKHSLIESAKNRDVTESKNKDIASEDYLFYPISELNEFALAYDISTEYFKKFTTIEHVSFLELNYNLKITIDSDYQKNQIDVNAIQEIRSNTKKLIGFHWLNNIDEVLSALYRLTDKLAIKKSIEYIGMNPSNEIYDLVNNNLKTFENLQKQHATLERLNVENINSILIDLNTLKPNVTWNVSRKIKLHQNIETIENPQTKTDQMNKRKLSNFIKEAQALKHSKKERLVALWNKQRCNSINPSSYNLLDLVEYYQKDAVF